MAEFVEIEFQNWVQYNPRTDAKKPSWFRFENSLVESPQFFDWPGDEFKVLIYLLSQASKKNSARVSIRPDHPESAIRVGEAVVRRVIQKLAEMQVISVTQSNLKLHASNIELPRETRTLRTNERTNETERNETNERTLAPSVSAKPLAASASPLAEFEPIAEVIVDRGITERVQQSWLQAFPDAPWIISEVRKAIAWETSDPKRRKKRFGPFMTNWLTRGWDQRRIGPPNHGGRNYAADREAQNRAALDEYLAGLGGEK